MTRSWFFFLFQQWHDPLSLLLIFNAGDFSSSQILFFHEFHRHFIQERKRMELNFSHSVMQDWATHTKWFQTHRMDTGSYSFIQRLKQHIVTTVICASTFTKTKRLNMITRNEDNEHFFWSIPSNKNRPLRSWTSLASSNSNTTDILSHFLQKHA